MKPNPRLHQIESLEDQLNKAIQIIQNLSVGMPPVLESDGLTGTFEWLQSHMKQTRGLEVHLTAEREFRMAEEMRVLLFQAVRGLLENVDEHAGVRQASVRIGEKEGDLLIEVSDEGRGFDPNKLEDLSPEEGFGLTAARERLRLYGGDPMARSAPGEETRVTLRVRLERSLNESSDLLTDSSAKKHSAEEERAEVQTKENGK